MISFESALKLARRNTYIWKDNWKVAVVCPTTGVLEHAWELARMITEASSLAVDSVNISRRIITTQHGATIRFFHVQGPLDAYRMGGLLFTQIMLVDYTEPLIEQEYLHSLLRSAVVEYDKCLWQPHVLL